MRPVNLATGTKVEAENPEKGIATINYDGTWVCTLIYSKEGRWLASSEIETIKKSQKRGLLCLLRFRPSLGQHIVIRKVGKEYSHGYLE